MILIALAGLPGTGKSTLARELSTSLRAPLLDKDRIREALFGPLAVDYTRAQDDLCCSVLYTAIGYLARRESFEHAILDGRTYSRRAQVEDLVAFTHSAGIDLRLVACRCSAATARARLERDALAGTHPSRNRSFELYRRLRDESDPIELPHLVLETDRMSLDELAARALAFVRGP